MQTTISKLYLSFSVTLLIHCVQCHQLFPPKMAVVTVVFSMRREKFGYTAISDGIVQESVAEHQNSPTLADPLFHPGVGPVCLRCNLSRAQLH